MQVEIHVAKAEPMELSHHLEASDFVNVGHLLKQLPADYCGSGQVLGQESEKPKEESW